VLLIKVIKSSFQGLFLTGVESKVIFIRYTFGASKKRLFLET